MAYPPEGSDWEASLSMNSSVGDVNTMNANRLIPLFHHFVSSVGSSGTVLLRTYEQKSIKGSCGPCAVLTVVRFL